MLGRIPRFLQQGIAQNVQCQSVRNKYRIRGKPPTIARSLQQVLDRIAYVEPDIAQQIDIGPAPPKKLASDLLRSRRKFLAESKVDANLEKAARNMKLDVSLEDVKNEWLNSDAPHHVRTAAEHYGVFKDLFGDAYFTPYINLDIIFPQIDGKFAPVYRGNVVKPSEATSSPTVRYSANDSDLWTLVLTNPDGCLTETDKECVHWFVGNIPGNDVSKGEEILDYLQPYPPLGVGYQRCIFVLYKQEGRIDYTQLKQKSPCRDLQNRTFHTLDFYKSRQDILTPSGLAFFQTDWDKSVRDVFHNQLNMEEPRFEYDFTPRYVKPARWFARRKAFNLYLDKYRKPTDIAKEYLVKKLADLDPFQTPQKPFPYPNIYKFDRTKTPSWLITEKRRVRLGLGRINQQRNYDDA